MPKAGMGHSLCHSGAESHGFAGRTGGHPVLADYRHSSSTRRELNRGWFASPWPFLGVWPFLAAEGGGNGARGACWVGTIVPLKLSLGVLPHSISTSSSQISAAHSQKTQTVQCSLAHNFNAPGFSCS